MVPPYCEFNPFLVSFTHAFKNLKSSKQYPQIPEALGLKIFSLGISKWGILLVLVNPQYVETICNTEQPIALLTTII